MAATLEVDEINGASLLLCDGVDKLDYGSTDAHDLDPVVYPVSRGSQSFEN